MPTHHTKERAAYPRVIAIDPDVRTPGVATFAPLPGVSTSTLIQVARVRTITTSDAMPAILEAHRLFWKTWAARLVPESAGGRGVLGVTIIVEGQRAYGDRTNHVDRRDVVSLAQVAAVAILAFTQLAGVPAMQVLHPDPAWKGQRKKDAHHDTARDVLNPAELAMFNDAPEDARDAVCLGLWGLGRLR